MRLIRRDHSYSINEIADLFGVHPNAVRRWMKDGLRQIDSFRPQLIHGTELIAYLDRRQSTRKRRCAPNEMYCFKCREPRRASAGRVVVCQSGCKRLTIRARCEQCGTRMNRGSTPARLPEIGRTFTITTASPRLDGTFDPIDKCEPKAGK